MMPIILYSSKGGNTKKVAKAIESELKCPAIEIGKDPPTVDLKAYDLVFVGTGIYFASINPHMQRVLESLNLQVPKRFALFLTWGGVGKAYHPALIQLKRILERKNQQVEEAHFKCYGGRSHVLVRRGHPNSQDLHGAREWAKKQSMKVLRI